MLLRFDGQPAGKIKARHQLVEARGDREQILANGRRRSHLGAVLLQRGKQGVQIAFERHELFRLLQAGGGNPLIRPCRVHGGFGDVFNRRGGIQGFLAGDIDGLHDHFHAANHLGHLVRKLLNDVADLGRRMGCPFGQLPDFVGNHGETASAFTRTRRFNGRIQGQQVGLLGNALDHLHNVLNQFGELLEVLNLARGAIHLFRRFFQLADVLLHITHPFPRKLLDAIRMIRGLTRLGLNFRRDVMRFLHRLRDVLGIILLCFAGYGDFIRNRSHLKSRLPHVARAIFNFLQYLMQLFLHQCHGRQQLPGFVAAVDHDLVVELAVGNLFGNQDGIFQVPADPFHEQEGEKQPRRNGKKTQKHRNTGSKLGGFHDVFLGFRRPQG